MVGRCCWPSRPSILVTGAACNRRWEIVDRRKRESEKIATEEAAAPAPLDAWERTAKMVEEYERNIGESTLDVMNNVVCEMQRQSKAIEAIDRALTALCKAWGIQQ